MSSSPREEILTAFRSVLPLKPGIVVVHSSFAKLVPPQSFAPWDALYTIGTLANEGWTFALPAFTFSFCGQGHFSKENSPSETGLFSEWLLKYFPEARRTSHPIYSFAILGREMDAIAACKSSTTFGDDSPFGLFEKANAVQVMLGCGWGSCTFLHRFEETSQVPYRHYKDFHGTTRSGNHQREIKATMFVRDLQIDAQNDFSALAPALADASCLKHRSLFRGTIQAAMSQDVASASRALLEQDPFAFVANANASRAVISARKEADSQPPVKLAILASTNVDRLAEHWKETLYAFLPERRHLMHKLDFGQMEKAIADSNSSLNDFAPDFRVFCERLEDLGAIDDEDAIFDALSRYAASIERLHSAHEGWTIILRFAQLTPSAFYPGADHGSKLVDRLNKALEERLAGLEQVIWLDLASQAAHCESPALDNRLWFVGKFPFSEALNKSLAAQFTGSVLAVLGKTARLVITDLDNTCWGGVLGEDGLEGILVGGDFPGNAYEAYQHELKALTKRGIALGIASKNDEDLAFRAFDELSSMVLKRDDFIGQQINWEPKWKNIRHLCELLNLGEASVLFIDDNPVEREQIRLHLPQVKILNLPEDPTGYAAAVRNSPFLAGVELTPEDKKRLSNLKKQVTLKKHISRSESMEDFYAGLGMTLHLNSLEIANAQRAVQLCKKTNQFNTTAQRYDLSELQAIEKLGGEVVVIGLEDRHSEFENIGLIVLKPETGDRAAIDLYLLSCRVLGRGLETAVARWVIEHARKRGWQTVRAVVIPTDRNSPVRTVFADSGYKLTGEMEWSADTSEALSLPKWLKVKENLNDL